MPIPYREILLTARIMDAIFEQVSTTRLQAQSDVQVDPVGAPAAHGRLLAD